MLLTITLSKAPATDLGFLLHKNPGRVHTRPLAFGPSHVFYSEATDERCTAALLLDIDPVGLVRGRRPGPSLEPYVNDRPYVASSFLSVALADQFGTAMNGRSKERQELADRTLPFEVGIPVLPARGGDALIRKLFEPLSYTVTSAGYPLDATFPLWGDAPYQTVQLFGEVRLAPPSRVDDPARRGGQVGLARLGHAVDATMATRQHAGGTRGRRPRLDGAP